MVYFYFDLTLILVGTLTYAVPITDLPLESPMPRQRRAGGDSTLPIHGVDVRSQRMHGKLGVYGEGCMTLHAKRFTRLRFSVGEVYLNPELAVNFHGNILPHLFRGDIDLTSCM